MKNVEPRAEEPHDVLSMHPPDDPGDQNLVGGSRHRRRAQHTGSQRRHSERQPDSGILFLSG
jgi:hypothetical protein